MPGIEADRCSPVIALLKSRHRRRPEPLDRGLVGQGLTQVAHQNAIFHNVAQMVAVELIRVKTDAPAGLTIPHQHIPVGAGPFGLYVPP